MSYQKKYTYILKDKKITVINVDYDHGWHKETDFLKNCNHTLKEKLLKIHDECIDLRITKDKWGQLEKEKWNPILDSTEIINIDIKIKRLRKTRLGVIREDKFYKRQKLKDLENKKPKSRRRIQGKKIEKTKEKQEKIKIKTIVSDRLDDLNQQINKLYQLKHQLINNRNSNLPKYYKTTWWKFRKNRFIIQKFIKNKGKLICEKCFKNIDDLSEIDIHHHYYQTPQLIEVEKDIRVKTDTSILFNESNDALSLLCSDCHVLEHTREDSDYNLFRRWCRGMDRQLQHL